MNFSKLRFGMVVTRNSSALGTIKR